MSDSHGSKHQVVEYLRIDGPIDVSREEIGRGMYLVGMLFPGRSDGLSVDGDLSHTWLRAEDVRALAVYAFDAMRRLAAVARALEEGVAEELDDE